jgi:hypothetical protein
MTLAVLVIVVVKMERTYRRAERTQAFIARRGGGGFSLREKGRYMDFVGLG